MLRAVVAAGCPAAYLVGDTADAGGCVRPSAERLGLVWVGTVAPRTTSSGGGAAGRSRPWHPP